MKKMLSDALREYHGLREEIDKHLLGKNPEKWVAAFKKCLREEPTWAEGMIYIPLEWSLDFGETPELSLQKCIEVQNLECGKSWRLPTEDELDRALRTMKPSGFSLWKYYWSSSPWSGKEEGGNVVTYAYDEIGGLGSCSSNNSRFTKGQIYPCVRLCREKK